MKIQRISSTVPVTEKFSRQQIAVFVIA